MLGAGAGFFFFLAVKHTNIVYCLGYNCNFSCGLLLSATCFLSAIDLPGQTLVEAFTGTFCVPACRSPPRRHSHPLPRGMHPPLFVEPMLPPMRGR